MYSITYLLCLYYKLGNPDLPWINVNKLKLEMFKPFPWFYQIPQLKCLKMSTNEYK